MGTKLIDRVQRIFATADRLNLDEWIAYFVEDARFQFGNTKPITGHDAIRLTMTQFFSAIKAMHHDFDGMYQQDNIVIAEANVMFTRLDDKVVRIPAVTIFRMQGDLVQDFRLYMDATPIFA
jgi:limonene-1,2-epoxide hydrolase